MSGTVKTILSSLGILVFLASSATAVCPVCTVAVGAGLEGARLLGVDDVITGIWAGALTLSLFFWTVSWLKKHNVNSVFWQILVPFLVYYGLLAGVYFLPNVQFGANMIFGIDKFLVGTVVGTFAFYFGARWYSKIKRENGGRAKFAFQKVFVPISFLLVATALFSLIVYL